MIYQNNYYFSGVTAIIYKYELDYPLLGFYKSTKTSEVSLNINNGITELGIEYKKHSEQDWNKIKISNDSQDSIVSGSLSWATGIIKEKIEDNYNFHIRLYELGRTSKILPCYIVIRNLLSNTLYDIRSYYILNSTIYYFNSCSPTTLEIGDVEYECKNLIDTTSQASQETLNTLKNNLDISCRIYNEICSLHKNTSPSDNLYTAAGGKFSAYYGAPEGTGATSSMRFNRTDLPCVVHEMAHNIMVPAENVYHNYIDGQDINSYKIEEITKFMEFASHFEGAYWKWLGLHNYPVISSYDYSLTDNYLVAAACYINRKIFGYI